MKKMFLIVFVVAMFSVLLSACGSLLTPQCKGGTRLTLQAGDRFLLHGEEWSWTGDSLQYRWEGGYVTIPLDKGGSVATMSPDSGYRIFRCGESDFSIWKTEDLLPRPTPMPTQTIIVIP